MITVVSAYFELHVCPTVIFGKTSDGSTIFARYRWGHLSIRIEPPNKSDSESGWIYSEQIGDEYDGCLDYDTLREITREMIEWPEEPAQ